MAEAATTGAVGITAVEDSTGAVDLTAAAGVGLQVADLPAIGAASQAGARVFSGASPTSNQLRLFLFLVLVLVLIPIGTVPGFGGPRMI